MKTNFLQQDSLLAIWRTLALRRDFADTEFELNPGGDVLVRDEDPWHQIIRTDVFCQLATQLGPRVALRLPIVTRAFGVLVPDVVWMPEEKWPDMMQSKGLIPLPSRRTCAWKCCSAMPCARPVSAAGRTLTFTAERRRSLWWVSTGL
jgi:hypothetical protein